MKMLKIIVAVLAVLVTGIAHAGFMGKFYDTGGLQGGGTPLTDSMTAVEAFLGTSPTPDATFVSTGIDYGLAPYTLSDLGTFLGSDAASLDPAAEGTTSLLGSVVTLTGTIALNAGVNVFDVFSDDGFSLLIDGTEIGRFEGLRAPSSSVINYDAGAGGFASFALIWFEGSLSQAALTVRLNNEIITAVPEPSTVSILGLGLLGLALARRKRA